MTTILDGKKLRDKVLNELKTRLDKYEAKPTLVVILVGENPASKIYVNNKKKTAESLGIKSIVINYPEDTQETELLEKINELNNDPTVSAILVQLPLPKHIDKFKIINTIVPSKDVDGFTPDNAGRLFIGEKPFAYPCTPKGIIRLLEEYHIPIAGKHTVIVGRSNIVGKPLAQMLLDKNSTVTICHSRTENLAEITKTADILISAVGGKIIWKNMVKSNCVVVDVGIFKDENGKTRGDVDFDEVASQTSFISPVPGGVGPMTIAMLMENTVELFEKSL